MEKDTLNYDTQELITYIRQGVRGETAMLPKMQMINEAKQYVANDRKHDLIDFLKRPFDIALLQWTNTVEINEELVSDGIVFPNVLMSNPQFKEKVRGFLLLRGNLKIRLLINAQKFQQGKLLAYWIPNYDSMPKKAQMIRASLSGKSGCPHTKISCEAGTEQTIDIPYVNQNLYYNMATDQGNYGRFFLTPLLKLKGTSTESVGVRIQVWMENPELEFPTTAVPVLSQAASQVEEASYHSDNLAAPSNGGLDVRALAGMVKDVNMSPSYLAKTAANAFELLGWQKPTQNAAIHRVSLRTNSYMANFNGEHMAHKLSLAADNMLAPMSAPAGTNIDEMNVNTICKVPTYYRNFDMKALNSTGQSTENTVLFVDRVHPQKFVNASASVLNSTFIGYVSSCASLWRGGIKYSFDVAKTCFHSGTVRVSFLPGVYDVTEGPPPANSPTLQLERAWQQTFDLRDRDEFSVTIPYVNSKYFSHVVNPFSSAADNIDISSYCTGVLVVDVFIPLVAPVSVNSVIDFAVWVSAGDDFMLANPTAPPIFPYSVNLNPVFNDASTTRKWHTVDSQSLGMTEPLNREEEMFSSTPTINGSTPDTSFRPSALCTGEVMASIKSLMGRFGPFAQFSAQPTATSFTLAPFNFQIPLEGLGDVIFDYIDYFSYLYGFFRGGVRVSLDPGYYDPAFVGTWRVLLRSSLSNAYPVTNIPRAEITSSSTFTTQILKSPFANILSRPTIEGIVDVEVPYYNQTHIAPVTVTPQTKKGVERAFYPSPLVTFIPRTRTNTATADPNFWRAASDDFRFSYLLGPPQVILLSSDPTTIPEQSFNVVYPRTPITRTGQNFAGIFGFPLFTVPTSSPGVALDPPSQFITTNGANTLYLLPRNVDYRFWSNNSPTLTVANSQWTGLSSTSLWPQTSRNLLYTIGAGQACTNYNIIAPLATLPQAAPKPCASFANENITITATTVTIPSQQTAPILFANFFALAKPMLGSPQELNNPRTAVIDAGTLVRFGFTASTSTLFFSVGATVYQLFAVIAGSSFTTATSSATAVETINI